MAPPPAPESDVSEEVSSVLLALPDGPVEAGSSDIKTHTISFLGGYPTFPPVPGPSTAPESVRCGVCHQPIPLLAQVYCPLENGENDRTIYVWACARPGCRRREGTIRAFRASARNEEYVADVEAKRAEAERIAAEERAKARINPFTVKDAPAGGALFGGGQPLFGAAPSNPFGAPSPAPAAAAAAAAPTTPLASLKIGEPSTLAPPLPAYQPAQYLTTIDEYLPLPGSDDESDIESDEDEAPEAKAEWRDEGWEKLLPKGVDDIFERFVRRLESAEDGASQVLRYDFNAVPLPYSSSSPLFKKLFPKAPTRAPSSEEEEVNLSEFYTDASIPKCTRCGKKRVFELQLVPQLINVLRPAAISTDGKAPAPAPAKKPQTEAERKAELQRLAKGELADGEAAEMEWGNIMVFSCQADCVGVGEEWVGVEWEAVAEQ
ncbi:ribosome small subunit biogenesis protein [Vanrija pseudolonga]|uniref:Programmed cell death protein 2-like n=1 Tax=Vanrija pseudolonga TaxID=143232 RepID=A0AAF0YGD6_9TREE|nr:Programmed cell death protein 2-like [Vanrija pseudolonga]